MKKVILVMLTIASIMLLTVGCSNQTTTDPNSKGTEASSNNGVKKSPFKIDDINWSVEPAAIEGEQILSFNYTNNSKYVIIDVELEFKQKDTVTQEELKVFDNLKSKRSWTDEDVKKIYILGYNRKLCDPGETVAYSPCAINGTYTLVENKNQFDLMEPIKMSIAYIGSDNKIHASYYDYKTQTFTEDAVTKEAFEWSNSNLSSLLPKPEFKIVNISSDEDDRFFFKSYGVSNDDFVAYVKAVKTKGFTQEKFKSDKSYMATNSEGTEVNITYDMTEEMLTGSLSLEK